MGELLEKFPHTPLKTFAQKVIKIIPLCTNRQSAQVADLLLLSLTIRDHRDPVR